MEVDEALSDSHSLDLLALKIEDQNYSMTDDLETISLFENIDNLDITDQKSEPIKTDGSSNQFQKPSMQYSSKWLAETDFTNAIKPNESECSSEVYDTDDTSSLADSDVRAMAIDQLSLLKKYSLTELLHQREDGSFTDSNGNIFKDITVQNSEQVCIGNVTNVNIYKVKATIEKGKSKKLLKKSNKINELDENMAVEKYEDSSSSTTSLKIIPRKVWLGYEEFKSTPIFVIISYTGSRNNASTPEETMSIIRDIRQHHIGNAIFKDVGYNFLIGEDGGVYDGRGWKGVGAHTFGYNRYAIGISFVGTYITELPPEASFQALWSLLDLGVREKHIAADYKLLGHCQCSPSVSPGAIYEIIKQHPHWEPQPIKPSSLLTLTPKRLPCSCDGS